MPFVFNFSYYWYMKKRTHISAAGILIILLFLAACGQSRHNELTYRYIPGEDATELDSLKLCLLSDPGTEMMVLFPDSHRVTIRYNRFHTHQQVIERHFLQNGYAIELLSKKPVGGKHASWRKK